MRRTRPLLKVAAEEWLPWTKVEKDAVHGFRISGPMGEILKSFAKYSNFDYEIVQPHDHVWGNLLPNGTWTGMIGLADRQEIEFALGPFGISSQREQYVDFTHPIYNDDKSVLTVRPTIQNDIEGFIKPFTLNVWMLIFSSLLFTSFSLAFVEAVESALYGAPTRDATSKAFMWAAKTLTQEGSKWLPKRSAARLLVTTWLVASLVFMSCYGGILTAMLTAPKVTIPIDSLDDLVNQNKMPWRLQQGTLNFLNTFTGAAYRKAYSDVSGTTQSCWAVKEEISRGEFATICPGTVMKKIMSWDFSTTGGCHLYVGRHTLYNNDLYSVVFRTNSPYLEKANLILGILKESGFIYHWLDEQLTNVTQCMRPPSADRAADKISALTIETLAGPFTVLAGGYLLAALALITENVVSVTYRKQDYY